ncbi:MAG TPA: C69 family dipeptidase [Tenuifilaceae bacterium]|nr:C69 family dipeptidase [Tenuifilaceae bacterium]HRX32401.1 C69 family dipeptidase [Tenuifilaceae bacterium]
MKKITYLAVFGLLLGFTQQSNACTNFLVSKGASVDGSTMITYAADSHVLFGELYFRPAADYPAGAMQKIYEWDTGKYLGEIPQISHTYSVVGNMNEHQVSLGETTYGGREELVDSTASIDYGSLMYTALQRSKSAREAIKTMAELVEKYGYCSEGESFSVADKDEVWIFEMIGKGVNLKTDENGKAYNANKGAVWVAIRIPDGYISGHANQARITTFPLENGKTSISSKNLDKIFDPNIEVVYAQDVISFAREQGYFKGKDKDFSFSDTYAPVTFEGARFCEIRVWSFFKEVNKDMWNYFNYAKGYDLNHRMPLYIKPDRKLSVHDMMNFMRDHLENTELDMSKDPGAGPNALPYRWRPLTWEYEGKTYINERATATQQTGFSFVAQARNWLPDPIGGIFWFSVDDAASTVYFPVYCGVTAVPESYAAGRADMLTYCNDCAFWVFNKVSNFAYLRYNLMIQDIKKVQSELESQFINTTPIVDKRAENLYKDNPTEAVKLLTDYTVSTGNYVVSRWEKLFQHLLMKYMDGNVKQEDKNGNLKYNKYNFCPDHPTNPEYPDWWKKQVIENTGDKLLEPEEEKH